MPSCMVMGRLCAVCGCGFFSRLVDSSRFAAVAAGSDLFASGLPDARIMAGCARVIVHQRQYEHYGRALEIVHTLYAFVAMVLLAP